MKAMGCTVLVMTAALGLGCGGASAPESPSSPTLPAEFTGPGVYTVPAVPSVEFPLAKVRIEQTAGMVSLYYELPAALAGKSTSVNLTGTVDPDGTVQLSGADGTSTCTVSSTLLKCNEHLTGVHLAQPVSSTPPDPQEAAAQAFFEDPIGVLSLPLP
jgi:hypothetical protein